MPESKADQKLHRNEEIANFLICGDARGPGWLAHHPADRERAESRLRDRAENTQAVVVARLALSEPALTHTDH